MHVPAGGKVSFRGKNGHFLDIFSYQALNIKLLRGKNEFSVHDLSQKGPLNFIYYVHM